VRLGTAAVEPDTALFAKERSGADATVTPELLHVEVVDPAGAEVNLVGIELRAIELDLVEQGAAANQNEDSQSGQYAHNALLSFPDHPSRAAELLSGFRFPCGRLAATVPTGLTQKIPRELVGTGLSGAPNAHH